MIWTSKDYDPSKIHPIPSKRQEAQREWVVTKGQITAAKVLIEAVLRRSRLSKDSRNTLSAAIEFVVTELHKNSDNRWQQAQIKYPKKERSRRKKNETVTSS